MGVSYVVCQVGRERERAGEGEDDDKQCRESQGCIYAFNVGSGSSII